MSFTGKIAFGIILLIQLFLNQARANYTQDSIQLVQLIQKGKFREAEKTIEKRLKLAKSVPERIFLNQSLGDIKKLEGEMDIALEFWRKSNKLRLSYFGKNHAQIAWNYALESNYAYEVWDSPRTRIYADSCSAILNNLNSQQLIGTRAHLILNVLGEAYKQNHSSDTPEQFFKRYAHVEALYLRSIDIQKNAKSEPYHLAKTLHMLGNVYHDMTIYCQNKSLGKELVSKYYQKAMSSYQKALDIQEGLNGKTHYERGRTYFVMGLLHQLIQKDFVPNSAKKALNYFEESWQSYGYDSRNAVWYENVPNKVDFLMMLKYFTISLQNEFEATKNRKFLNQAESVNSIAISIWRIIHLRTQQSDINQKLSLYWLIPYQEYINIQALKLKNRQSVKLEEVFLANQKLKYFDILKKSETNRAFEGQSLKNVQSKLKDNEIFLDYFTDKGSIHLYVFLISKTDIEFVELDNSVVRELADFRMAILNFDFNTYTALGLNLYEKLIPQKARNFKKWIIAPDGGLHQLPFEALLVSKRNIKERDYRTLHYVLDDIEITYAFSTALYKGTLNSFPLSISAFSPSFEQKGLSILPFSEKLVNELGRRYEASGFVGAAATKSRFLNANGSLLHLSSHADINNVFSTYSILHFADDTLASNEVAFTTTPRFVVLNTCNSAMGKIHSGDGINGFVRTLLNLGSETVLANIWEVDDKASNHLLARFYEELHDGNSSHQALRNAKLHCIKNSPNEDMAAPFYWAGHHLFGEEIVVDKGGFNWGMWVMFVLTALIGLFVLRSRFL
jgi:CHAT domain-containing protein